MPKPRNFRFSDGAKQGYADSIKQFPGFSEVFESGIKWTLLRIPEKIGSPDDLYGTGYYLYKRRHNIEKSMPEVLIFYSFNDSEVVVWQIQVLPRGYKSRIPSRNRRNK